MSADFMELEEPEDLEVFLPCDVDLAVVVSSVSSMCNNATQPAS